MASRRRAVSSADNVAGRTADVWEVLRRLDVDPAEHFASLLLEGSDADDKRRDEAAKQLLPYCYAKRPTQPAIEPEGQLVGYVLCEE